MHYALLIINYALFIINYTLKPHDATVSALIIDVNAVSTAFIMTLHLLFIIGGLVVWWFGRLVVW